MVEAACGISHKSADIQYPGMKTIPCSVVEGKKTDTIKISTLMATGPILH